MIPVKVRRPAQPPRRTRDGHPVPSRRKEEAHGDHHRRCRVARGHRQRPARARRGDALPHPGRPPGGLALRGRDPHRALLRRHAHRPGAPGVGGARPLHPLQGPRRARLLRRAHAPRLLPRGAPAELRRARLPPAGPPRHALPRRRHELGQPRAGPLRGARHGFGGAPRGPAQPHLRAPGRRRAPGGPGLGGGDGGRQVRLRQPHGDRRRQPHPADGRHRGDHAGRLAGREVARLQLGRPRGRRPRRGRHRRRLRGGARHRGDAPR